MSTPTEESENKPVDPVVTTTKEKQQQKAPNTKNKQKRRKHRNETFSSHIHKVLKQVDPDVAISRRAMAVMDSFVHDVYERISTEASRLARSNKKRTLSSRDIQTATRIVLPSELAKHAVSEGTKAVLKYASSKMTTVSDHIGSNK